MNKDQISILNSTVKCTLRPSPLHGIGVFAIRDIKKGEKLYCHSMERKLLKDDNNLAGIRPEVRELILQRWPMIYKGSAFLSPNDDARLISFMNDGGKDSNYAIRTDTATKDIGKGEEVLEDYKLL